MEGLERVLEAHSLVNGEKRDGEAFFSMKLNLIHLPDGRRPSVKIQKSKYSCALLALSHPKVIRPKTRRPAGENYIHIYTFFQKSFKIQN